MSDDALLRDFRACFAGLAAIGRDPDTGGYRRLAWTDEDRAARGWFAGQAAARGLAAERDANGNLWAWWYPPGGAEIAAGEAKALVLGSHLDTVPQGGAYDGALGVVAGFVAVSALRRRGAVPVRPVAVAAFAEEEGGRFGLATLGSRLLAGSLAPGDVMGRRDASGATVAEAMRGDGLDPERAGRDSDLLDKLGELVEVHLEQGRGLADVPAPLGVGRRIQPHGRWRLELRGEPNHAGTTRLSDRRDPILPLATAITAAHELAARAGAVATIGRLLVEPNSTNSVPGGVQAWLDTRAPDDATLDRLLAAWHAEVVAAAAEHGAEATLTCESRTAAVELDPHLRARLAEVLVGLGLPAPDVETAAGHDAAALAEILPTAMVFVRNPTGASHSPAEAASDEDCALGCTALAAAVEAWVCR